MAGKLSKQELKEPDKFQVMLSQVMMYLAENKQKFYIAGGVLAAVLVIAGGWYLYDLNMEKSAQQSYARVYGAAGGEGAAAVGIYKDVSAKYPGSRAAALANYRLANLYYRQNDFDGAVKAYEAFLQRTSDKSDLKTLAYMGLAYSYEAKKDFKNALAAFEKASSSKAGQVYEGMNDQNIARVYEAMNDRAKALEYYQKALTKNTDPSAELLIKRKIAMLS
jgi:predicted negative regulator of RcsB-dependent stress response